MTSNQFEFLPQLPLGQYVPVDSLLHRIDPRARLLGFGLIILSLTITQSVWGILVGLAAALAGMVIGRIPLRYALRSLIAPLPFLLILVVLQILFNAGDGDSRILWSFGPLGPMGIFNLSISDFLFGLRLMARFFALILWLGLVSFTMSTSEMTAGLNQLLGPLTSIGLPAQDLAAMAQITIRFLPILAQTTENVAKAQASRGADWDRKPGRLFGRIRQIIPLIIPMFMVSLRKSEQMALAMDARAYGSVRRRTSFYEFHFSWVDMLVIIFLLGVSALIVAL